MKRLFYIALALVLITTIGCKRKDRAERLYERYLNDSNRVEFVIPSADTIAVEEEVEEEPEVDESEGLFTIPDTPEERGVNMNSSDAELQDIMEGKDVEKDAKKGKK
jgi:hypothetical protein